MLNYAGFIACAVVIFFAGKRLSYYGDLIAELTGLGKAWIGLILMASVTSLPELMVGISSSAIVESADLALGDILGSCALNLGILALMDAFAPKNKPLLGSASQSHVLAAALGLILIALAGIGLYLPGDMVVIPGVGLTSISFMVVYVVAVRVIYQYSQQNQTTDELSVAHTAEMSLKSASLWYALYAGVIIVAALFLPHFAEEIAIDTGLGSTFIGTLLLALSTSLPEVAVSMAAVRMGSVDLAVGNLLGSNIFNIFILFIDDVFYTKGHLLKDASDIHLLTVFCVILMSALAIIGLTYRSKRKQYLLAWDALAIFVIYLLNMVLLYKLE